MAEANLDDITKSPSLSEVHQLLLRRYVETFEFERGDAIIHLTTTCLANHKSPGGLEHLANRISCLSDVYTPTCKTIRFWEHNCQLDLQVVDGKALLKAHLVKVRKMADDNGLLGPCGNAFCLLIMGWMQIDVRQPASRSILPRWVPWVSPCPCRACWALEAFLHDLSDMAVQFEGLSISRRDHLVRQIQDSGLVQAAQIKFLHCYGDRVKVRASDIVVYSFSRRACRSLNFRRYFSPFAVPTSAETFKNCSISSAQIPMNALISWDLSIPILWHGWRAQAQVNEYMLAETTVPQPRSRSWRSSMHVFIRRRYDLLPPCTLLVSQLLLLHGLLLCALALQ